MKRESRQLGFQNQSQTVISLIFPFPQFESRQVKQSFLEMIFFFLSSSTGPWPDISIILPWHNGDPSVSDLSTIAQIREKGILGFLCAD